MVAIGDAHSLDVEYWQAALAAREAGTNPYETGVLNWPPLWLVVIQAVDSVAGLVNVAFWTALRVYLVLIEAVLVVTIYLTLASTVPAVPPSGARSSSGSRSTRWRSSSSASTGTATSRSVSW